MCPSAWEIVAASVASWLTWCGVTPTIMTGARVFARAASAQRARGSQRGWGAQDL